MHYLANKTFDSKRDFNSILTFYFFQIHFNIILALRSLLQTGEYISLNGKVFMNKKFLNI